MTGKSDTPQAPPAGKDGARETGPEGPWTARLAKETEAAFVVDPALSRIEGANAEACRLLGLRGAPIRFPVALDAAMPAVRRLRALSETAGNADSATASGVSSTEIAAGEEVLTLWCAGRLMSLPAKLTRTTMNDGRPVMLVRASPAHAAASSETEEAAPPPPPSAAPQGRPRPAEPAAAGRKEIGQEPMVLNQSDALPSPSPARDDGETLREIARRIREGGGARTITPPPLPAVSKIPSTPSQTSLRNHDVRLDAAHGPPRLPLQGAAPDARHLSKIAHELKTPLSAIIAAAEIMRDERLGPMGNAQYLGYAADIHESARHALDVINAMLTGTNSELRKSEIIDLAGLTDVTVSAMLPVASAGGITLDADGETGRLEVKGDATAIRQIIFNLISNALKFTPRGGDVRVTTGYLDNGTPFLVVRDTGEGMSEDEITAAFLERDTAGESRRGGGYGLGLPMVRRLAEGMQATIDVDSAPGKGTAILITFLRPQS